MFHLKKHKKIKQWWNYHTKKMKIGIKKELPQKISNNYPHEGEYYEKNGMGISLNEK